MASSEKRKKKEERGVFVREATGLVKEINSLHAAFYAITGTVGITAGLSLVYLVLYPVNIVWGLPISSWVTIGAGLMYILLGTQYAILSGLMPRTGGDYVFTSRIFSPVWGFIEGWTGVLAYTTFMGFSLYYAIYFLGVSLKIGAFLPDGQAFISAANWAFSRQGELLLSLPFVAFFIYVLGFRPTRTWLRLNSILGMVALVSVAIVVVLFLGSSTANVDHNLVTAAGVNKTQVIAAAKTAGFSPSPLTIVSIGGLLFNGIFWFTGYQFASYLSGEIKGNVRKVVMVSILAELAVSIVLAALFFLPLIYGIGYDFSNSWSGLYLAGASTTPLGSPPVPPLLLALVNPGLAGVAIVLAILILVGFEVATIVTQVTWCTRLVFAFSMDRILPSWFAFVRNDTGTPMNTTIVMLAGGYAFFLAQVFGLNPASTAYWATLLILPMLFFPALNTLLIKRRRPEIYALAPQRWIRKVAGLPLVMWAALLWLVFLSVSTVWFVDDTIATTVITSTQGLLSFTVSTGIVYVLVAALAGAAIYYVARAYNKRRGIDMDFVFKSIPPE